MKFKTNRKLSSKQSIFAKKFEITFENSGLGLTLSHEIFNIKLKNQNEPEISFSEFLQNFYYPLENTEFPHYIPVPADIYYGDLNQPPSLTIRENSTKNFLEKLSEAIIHSPYILNLIIGDAGSGKTSFFMAIANQCRQKTSTNVLMKENFLTCYLNINNENKDSPEDIISYSTGNKTIHNLDDYLGFSYPVIFFIDANALTKGIKETVFENKLNETELIKVIEKFKYKLDRINKNYNNKHRLFVIYRTNFQSAKSGNENLFNKLRQYSATWVLNPLDNETGINYIKNVSKETGSLLLSKLDYFSNDIVRTPLFIDFINWLALQIEGEDLKDYSINSISHLFLIFTREYFRKEYKQWENKDLFSWIKNDILRYKIISTTEEKFSAKYCNSKPYTLEEEPNQIELLLMVIVNKLGTSFRDDQLEKEIRNIINDKSYVWLDTYREWLEENKEDTKYLSNRKLNVENLVKHTLLKYFDESEIEFFHPSIGVFYLAKSMFYDLQKGILIPLEKKEHFENSLNKTIYSDVMEYFVNLLDLIIQTQQNQKYTSSFQYISGFQLNENSYINLGGAFYYLREYSIAIEIFQKAIQLDNKCYVGFHNLGNIYLEQEEYSKAIVMYQNAIEINTNNDMAYLNLGSIYLKLKEYSKAIEMLQKTIEINPNFDMAYYNFGLVYLELKDYYKAIELFLKSVDINSNLDVAYYNLGIVYSEMREYSKAAEMFQKAIDINPMYYEAYFNLGNGYLKLKEYLKAINMYQKAVEINPILDIGYYNLAITYSELREYSKNIEMLLKTIEINPNFETAYFELSFSYLELKEYAKAIEALQKLIEIYPENYEAYYYLGIIYSELEKYSEAIEMFLKTIKINSKLDMPYYYLGEAHYLTKQLEKAIQFFNKAIEINSELPESFKYLGMIYQHINEIYKAIEHFQKALDLNPEDEECSKCLSELQNL